MMMISKIKPMKQTLTFLFLLCSLFAIGQSKIQGIGMFKINKFTVADMDTFISNNYYKKVVVKTIMESVNSYHDRGTIQELMPDTTNWPNSPILSHLCKNVKVYYIPLLTISDIVVERTYLTFYNNLLSMVSTNYTKEIIEAFELKYGVVEIKKEEKASTCKEPNTINGASYLRVWTNDQILCKALFSFYWNDKCDLDSSGSIWIYEQNINTEIDNCDTKERTRLEKIQTALKKKKLEGF